MTEGALHASIVICTRNRAASLARTLAALSELDVPREVLWEVVVVDNGSTDDTSAVIAAAAGRIPVRSVTEPKAGLSNARNAGAAAARGRYLISTDDDVVPHRDWLAAYLRAFEAYPEAVVFGGPTSPVLEPPQQRWFAENIDALDQLLAVREFGASPRLLNHDDIPYGANYAVRAAEQAQHPYDPELGVAPGRRTGGEEIAVMRAMMASGGTGIWAPDARVDHMIPQARQTEAYVAQFYEANGAEYPPPVKGLAATPWGLKAGIALRRLRYVAGRRLGLKRWVGDLVAYARFKGGAQARLQA